MSNPVSNLTLDGSLLSHHVHSDNEPLPGVAGSASTVDYSPERIERVRLPPSEEGSTQDLSPHKGAHHHQHNHKQFHGHQAAVGVTCGEETAVSTETPTTEPATTVPQVTANTHDHHHDCAAHHAEPAITQPSFGDKVIGKTQELAGKVTHNEALQEKGELRKTGETAF